MRDAASGCRRQQLVAQFHPAPREDRLREPSTVSHSKRQGAHMPKVSSLLMIAVLLAAGFRAEAAPLNKCIVNGTVTYQQGPCAATGPRKDPTLEELNAAEKKKRAAAASAATGARTQAAPAATAPSGRFSCDGRQYCSQMKSCDEAKYFLANCPDPKMDGDGNGIPCEKQWCTR